MKFNKIMGLALASMLVVGCADLDTEPQGSTVTSEQKSATSEMNPDRVSASVTGITTMFSVYGNIYGTDNLLHNDFGYPSVMMLLDSRGVDLVGMDVGYNWFSYGFDLTDHAYTSRTTRMVWGNMYKQIYAANQVAATVDEETEDGTLQYFLAQALAIRAFDYFNLAQCYQFTYKGNEDALCVPLILDTNALEAGTNGWPRNTVGEVYEQIMKDINKAVALLESTDKTRDDKRYVDLAVAYGLRARIELVMQDWSAAAADAQKAIDNSSATPASFEDVSKPTFKDITEKDWMWGILIAETDRVVTSGIVNWISHMGSLNYGYASVGAWRRINPTLFAMINDTDARKGWWLDASGVSANLTSEQQDYLDGKIPNTTSGAPAYTQVKFAPYKDEIYTGTNANDVPLMRIEEMYLIKAEAQAMAGDAAAGRATLENFVKTYRDPAYTCAATTAEGVQNAVWVQRRIELWGEGLEYFDLLRLRKGIDRASTAYKTLDTNMPKYNFRVLDDPAKERAAIQQVLSGNGGTTGEDINALIFMIPNDEVQSNPQIDDINNNLGAPTLKPEN